MKESKKPCAALTIQLLHSVQSKAFLLFLILFGLLGTAGGTAAEEAPYYRDLFSDTWVGQDAHKH